jgi:CBS domain-containing protein
LTIPELKSFITNISPFDRLNSSELDTVTAAVDIEYFKSGTKLINRGESPLYLYIVIKGIIAEQAPDSSITLYETQDTFSALALLSGTSKSNFTVQEEALCYLLPQATFLNLSRTNPNFGNFYYQTLSQRLNWLMEQREAKELASFMVAKIRDTYIHPPIWVAAEDSIYRAVEILKQHKATSVLVKNGNQTGIVTDTDIREHVVLQRKSVDTPVGAIATYQLLGMKSEEFLFNALLQMTRHTVKRLVIDDGENIIGVLDQMDLLSYFSHHSHLVNVQIERATDMDQLKKASRDLANVIQALYGRGVKIHAITQLVTELNRKLFRKLYNLLIPQAVITNSCLIVMGSEGRGEQILKTDQDNALILRNGFAYSGLNNLLKQFTIALKELGYPPCRGEVMVSNPQWVKPLDDFCEQIYAWLNTPQQPASLMNLAIFYDATAVAGDSALLAATKDYLWKHLESTPVFFTHFAKTTLAFETPLGWFAQFIVDKQHDDGLDLKKGGIFPIVHGVRSLALEHKLIHTNTIERIQMFQEMGQFNREFAEELTEAFAFMLSLRLETELQQLQRNEPLNDYIQPHKLSKPERDLLRDSLKIVNRFKEFITYHFRLNMIT